jgi:excisionase family DNA binding protein
MLLRRLRERGTADGVTGRPDFELAGALVDALRPFIAEVVREELERIGAETARTEWLTVEEFAEVMRTTPGAVLKRLERGRIAGAEREGRRWLIPAAATEAKVAVPDNKGRAPHQRPRPGTRR